MFRHSSQIWFLFSVQDHITYLEIRNETLNFIIFHANFNRYVIVNFLMKHTYNNRLSSSIYYLGMVGLLYVIAQRGQIISELAFFFLLVCIHEKYLFSFVNGILLPKLFWPTVRKNCSSDRRKLLKFEAEGREFPNFWDH